MSFRLQLLLVSESNHKPAYFNLLAYTGLCHNHAMILYVYIGEIPDAGGVLTFYLPSTIDEP